jgi:AcrR family transcriptional regulator
MARQRLAELGDEAAIRIRILDEARALVRRHGAAKVNVTDISRALGISHTSLYRHFASKADLIDALGAEAMAEDEAIAVDLVGQGGPAAARLEALALSIHLRKCDRFRTDGEVHALYERVARLRPDLVRAYAERMTWALASIIADGVALGEFRSDLDPLIAAGLVRDALTVFVHPVLVAAEGGAPAEERLRAVVRTLARGFGSG